MTYKVGDKVWVWVSKEAVERWSEPLSPWIDHRRSVEAVVYYADEDSVEVRVCNLNLILVIGSETPWTRATIAEFRAGDKVVYNGQVGEVLETNRQGRYPVRALFEAGGSEAEFTADGRLSVKDKQGSLILLERPEKKEDVKESEADYRSLVKCPNCFSHLDVEVKKA